MSYAVGQRCGLDLVWLWVRQRPVATNPVPPLAWKPPYATGVALKRHTKKRERKKNKKKKFRESPPYWAPCMLSNLSILSNLL